MSSWRIGIWTIYTIPESVSSGSRPPQGSSAYVLRLGHHRIDWTLAVRVLIGYIPTEFIRYLRGIHETS